MITIFLSAIITATLFLLISFLISGIWLYFVPSFLLITILWLQLQNRRNKSIAVRVVAKYSDTLLEVEKKMLLSSPSLIVPQFTLIAVSAKSDLASAVGILLFIGILGAIIYLILNEWIAALFSIMVLLYLWMSNILSMFLTNNSKKDAERAAWRLDGFNIPDDHLNYLTNVYSELLIKLEYLLKKK